MATLQTRVIRNARARGVNVQRRRQWGSKHLAVYKERLTTRPVTKAKADTYVSHITVTFDSGVLVGDFYKDMQTIERIGWERFGSGVSYNWVIDKKTGMVGEGANLLAKGTHTVNDKGVAGYSYDQNAVARAWAWLGNPADPISDKAKEAAARLMAAQIEEEALTKTVEHVPHRLFAAKECPGDNAVVLLGPIKKRALYLLNKERVARPDVVALRDHIKGFLGRRERPLVVRTALTRADDALEKIQWKRG